jgi:protein OS-9
MVIWTPRLCNDAAFQPPEATKPHAIDCAPVMAENFIPGYLAGQEHQDAEGIAAYDAETDTIAHELMEELAEAVIGGTSGKAAKHLGKVGDIEIGAYHFLPKGTKLEKGAVVGGGKEKILATIAKSNGYMASDRELAKLSIRNNKDVEAVKKEVERVAEGKEWQLDVVETPRGRELRGIIAKDEKTTKTRKKLKPKQQKVDQDEDDRQDHEAEVEKEAGSDETYKEEL